MDEYDEDEEDADRNCVLTFGCGPNSTVSAVSTIAHEYLQRFSQGIDDHGTITFPSMDFLSWSPGDGGDHVILFKE